MCSYLSTTCTRGVLRMWLLLMMGMAFNNWQRQKVHKQEQQKRIEIILPLFTTIIIRTATMHLSLRYTSKRCRDDLCFSFCSCLCPWHCHPYVLQRLAFYTCICFFYVSVIERPLQCQVDKEKVCTIQASSGCVLMTPFQHICCNYVMQTKNNGIPLYQTM